jgi:hypothetical protein
MQTSSLFESVKPFACIDSLAESLGGHGCPRFVVKSSRPGVYGFSSPEIGELRYLVSLKNGVSLLVSHDKETEAFEVAPVRNIDEFNLLEKCGFLPARDSSKPECCPESHLCFEGELKELFGRYAEIPSEVIERIGRDDDRAQWERDREELSKRKHGCLGLR